MFILGELPIYYSFLSTSPCPGLREASQIRRIWKRLLMVLMTGRGASFSDNLRGKFTASDNQILSVNSKMKIRTLLKCYIPWLARSTEDGKNSPLSVSGVGGRRWFQEPPSPPQMPPSTDAQVLLINWPRTLSLYIRRFGIHGFNQLWTQNLTCSWLNPQMQKPGNADG